MDACSSNYSEWNTDEKWSSQERKSDEVLEARTVRPVSEQPACLFTQHTDRFIVDDGDMVLWILSPSQNQIVRQNQDHSCTG